VRFRVGIASSRFVGMWKGDNFTERLNYDMTDPAIIGRAGSA
jgi:hypothetical protein